MDVYCHCLYPTLMSRATADCRRTDTYRSRAPGQDKIPWPHTWDANPRLEPRFLVGLSWGWRCLCRTSLYLPRCLGKYGTFIVVGTIMPGLGPTRRSSVAHFVRRWAPRGSVVGVGFSLPVSPSKNTGFNDAIVPVSTFSDFLVCIVLLPSHGTVDAPRLPLYLPYDSRPM